MFMLLFAAAITIAVLLWNLFRRFASDNLEKLSENDAFHVRLATVTANFIRKTGVSPLLGTKSRDNWRRPASRRDQRGDFVWVVGSARKCYGTQWPRKSQESCK